MELIGLVLTVVVALMHAGFLVLEMFFWTSPRALAAFGNTPAFALQSKVMAANQGLYNGFLAAGLLWGVVAGDPVGFPVRVYFLACVVVAALYAAATVNSRVAVIQGAPAALALAATVLAR